MPDFFVPENLPEWIRDHVRRYLESDGADGHMWDASIGGGTGLVPTLLLTTVGRKSGNAGAPTHPAWYLNLCAQPEVDVQVEARRFRARARTASGEERKALWDQMVGIYAPYTEYQGRAEREIPVVVLDPVSE
jgi:proline iminopeptidase